MSAPKSMRWARPPKHQLDTLVSQRLAPRRLGSANRLDDAGGLMFKYAGPDPVLDVLASARFQDHRIDAQLSSS
ncbi:MAG: hypothetical protein WDM77_19870 [Steroidobacteraceae bacterium]